MTTKFIPVIDALLRDLDKQQKDERQLLSREQRRRLKLRVRREMRVIKWRPRGRYAA